MAKKYPYPKVEHYVEPAHPLDVLSEEMRLYPEPAEFREGIFAIEKYYEKTPLFDCLKKYAVLDVAALKHVAGREAPAQACSVFYAGEILAAHAMLKPLPKLQRQQALGTDFFPNMPWGIEGFDPEDEALAFHVEELVEQRQMLWEDFCDERQEETKEKLVDVTVHACADLPNAGHLEDQFMGGYLFAEGLVIRALADSVEYQL